MGNSKKKFLYCSVIIVITYFLNVSHALSAKENDSDYNKQISDLLGKGNCKQAESIAKQVAEKNKDSIYLPDWYHQIIECHKKRHEGWGDLELRIDDFINAQIDKLVKGKSCIEAEKYITTIDRKYYAYWSYSAGLYKVASCYETVNPKKSTLLYQRILSDYAASDEAIEAKQRLKYLSGNRAWIYPKASVVIDGVKTGLIHKDVMMLKKYASRSNFQIGFEEEWSPVLFDEKGEKILNAAFKRSKPQIGPLTTEPHRYMLLVTFPAEDHPFWYFTFDELEGGWQWTGIIISNHLKGWMLSG